MLKKLIFSCFLCVLAVSDGWSQAISSLGEPELQRLRSQTSGTVYKCSPEGGGDGSLTPMEVFSKAKKGDTVRFAYGNYQNEIDVNMDKMTLEIDPDSKPSRDMSLQLRISGGDCLVRNLRLSSLTLNDNCIVLDSEIRRIEIKKHNLKKTVKQSFVNCLIGCVYANHIETDINLLFRNCLFYSDSRPNMNGIYSASDRLFYFSGISDTAKVLVEIQKCVFTGSACFALPGTEGTKAKFSVMIADSILYATDMLAEVRRSYYSEKKRNNEVARDIKSFKDVLRGLTIKGKTEVAKPDFTSENAFRGFCQGTYYSYSNSGFSSTVYSRRSQSNSSKTEVLDYRCLTLKDGSPGKAAGAGIYVDEDGALGPVNQDKGKDKSTDKDSAKDKDNSAKDKNAGKEKKAADSKDGGADLLGL